MIGYYAHHVGSGHRHRATAAAPALGDVTGLSSAPAPPGWAGSWVELDRDDSGTGDDGRSQHTAGGRLHWVPLGDPGLRSRMATISAWLERVRPAAVVVDVSVEVALLVRLHGVPVVAVVVPGWRGDPPHLLGLDVADALVGCWPPEATGMVRGVPAEVLDRVQPLGALSRFPVADPVRRRPGPPRVTVLGGTGGNTLTREHLRWARAETPEWEWTVLDRELGTWAADPSGALLGADVVVTHAGEGALAEVAASRTPAVVVPQPRPHREQETTAEVLRAGPWPAVVVDGWPSLGWADRLAAARSLDGGGWASWCDGRGADRLASVVASVVASSKAAA